MAFGLADAAERSADPFGPEWLAWEAAPYNKPNAISLILNTR